MEKGNKCIREFLYNSFEFGPFLFRLQIKKIKFFFQTFLNRGSAFPNGLLNQSVSLSVYLWHFSTNLWSIRLWNHLSWNCFHHIYIKSLLLLFYKLLQDSLNNFTHTIDYSVIVIVLSSNKLFFIVFSRAVMQNG